MNVSKVYLEGPPNLSGISLLQIVNGETVRGISTSPSIAEAYRMMSREQFAEIHVMPMFDALFAK